MTPIQMLDILSTLFSLNKSRMQSLKGYNPSVKKGLLYSKRYELPEADVVVPVKKYRLLKEQVEREAALKNIPIFEVTDGPAQGELELVHDADYLYEFMEFIPTARLSSSEVPFTFEVQEFFLHATEASRQGLYMARESNGIFINMGGGFHHGFRDHAEGFCYLNDIAFAVEIEQKRKPGRALIIDLDVHQGNGVIAHFRGRKDVVVANLHQSDNYPLKEEGGLDVELPGGTTGDVYLKALQTLFDKIDEAGNDDRFTYAIYLAGADPYKKDRLGGFLLSKKDLIERDRQVNKFLNQRQIPFLVTLAGGYSSNIDDVVEIHMNMVREMMKEE